MRCCRNRQRWRVDFTFLILGASFSCARSSPPDGDATAGSRAASCQSEATKTESARGSALLQLRSAPSKRTSTKDDDGDDPHGFDFNNNNDGHIKRPVRSFSGLKDAVEDVIEEELKHVKEKLSRIEGQKTGITKVGRIVEKNRKYLDQLYEDIHMYSGGDGDNNNDNDNDNGNDNDNDDDNDNANDNDNDNNNDDNGDNDDNDDNDNDNDDNDDNDNDNDDDNGNDNDDNDNDGNDDNDDNNNNDDDNDNNNGDNNNNDNNDNDNDDDNNNDGDNDNDDDNSDDDNNEDDDNSDDNNGDDNDDDNDNDNDDDDNNNDNDDNDNDDDNEDNDDNDDDDDSDNNNDDDDNDNNDDDSDDDNDDDDDNDNDNDNDNDDNNDDDDNDDDDNNNDNDDNDDDNNDDDDDDNNDDNNNDDNNDNDNNNDDGKNSKGLKPVQGSTDCWGYCYFALKCASDCSGVGVIGSPPSCAANNANQCQGSYPGGSSFSSNGNQCQCQCSGQRFSAGGAQIFKAGIKTKWAHQPKTCDGNPLSIGGKQHGNLGKFDPKSEEGSKACSKACLQSHACIFASYQHQSGHCTAFGSCEPRDQQGQPTDVYEKSCA